MTMTFATRMFGAATLALMGLVAAELATGASTEQAIPDAAPRTPSPAPPSPQERPEQRDQSAARVSAALARPLFTPDRRPPSPDAAPVAASNTLPRLAGTLVIPGRRQALFETGSKQAAMGEGSRIDAWTVEAISPGVVTLAGPGGPRVLHVSSTRDGRVQEARATELPVIFRPIRTHSRTEVAINR